MGRLCRRALRFRSAGMCGQPGARLDPLDPADHVAAREITTSATNPKGPRVYPRDHPARAGSTTYLGSTVGHKVMTALTGLGLAGFVVFHMIGNLKLLPAARRAARRSTATPTSSSTTSACSCGSPAAGCSRSSCSTSCMTLR